MSDKQVRIDRDEAYPVYYTVDDDESFGRFVPMTAEELADFERVEAEHYKWQDELNRRYEAATR